MLQESMARLVLSRAGKTQSLANVCLHFVLFRHSIHNYLVTTTGLKCQGHWSQLNVLGYWTRITIWTRYTYADNSPCFFMLFKIELSRRKGQAETEEALFLAHDVILFQKAEWMACSFRTACTTGPSKGQSAQLSNSTSKEILKISK